MSLKSSLWNRKPSIRMAWAWPPEPISACRSEPETSELVLISAPWDVTVSYGAGTAYAPDAIIEASTQLDFYDPLAPDAWRRGIATADVDYTLLEQSQRLRSDAERVIDHLEGAEASTTTLRRAQGPAGERRKPGPECQYRGPGRPVARRRGNSSGWSAATTRPPTD